MNEFLFGKKRQTNYDDTSSQYRDWQKANLAANDYYANNIANVDWNSLSSEEKNKRSSEFNRLRNQRAMTGMNYQDMLDTSNYENEYYKNKPLGDGMIGAIFNPALQTLDAAKDLIGGSYTKKGRDWVSDLGAAAETALMFVPGLNNVKALTTSGKISKAGMALNALSGAGANVASQFREGGANTDMNDLTSAALTGAAFGGLVPAAMSKGGQFIKNRGAKALGNTLGGATPTSRQLTTAGIKSLIPQSRVGRLGLAGAGLYGASRLLGGGGQAQVPNYQSQLDITQGGYY